MNVQSMNLINASESLERAVDVARNSPSSCNFDDRLSDEIIALYPPLGISQHGFPGLARVQLILAQRRVCDVCPRHAVKRKSQEPRLRFGGAIF